MSSDGRERYVYIDEAGEPVALKDRKPTPTGKSFLPAHRDDGGKITHEGRRYTLGLPSDELKAALYRLPELVAKLKTNRPGNRIYWCEGERDAVAVAVAGKTGTTVLQSGSRYVELAAQRFAGFRGLVFVVADRDPAGYAQALAKRKALEALGVRVQVREPRMPSHNDLTDHLESGLTLGQLVSVLDLEEKAARHEPGTPGNGSEWPANEAARDPSGATSADDELAKAVAAERWKAQVRREARRLDDADAAGAAFEGFAGASLDVALKQTPNESPWLIEGLMRVGHKVGVVAGFKTGKTTLLGNVARSLVDGVPLFGRFDVADVGGSMVVFDFELVTGDAVDMYRRLDIAHPDRVFVESLRGQRFSLVNDVHAEMVVKFLRSRDAAIWALDPFARAMRGFGSADDNDDVGAFLDRVDEIVSEAGVKGVLIPAHTGRGQAEVGTEHSRGATRFDDDVDARWIYTRDGSQQRFFRAEGRNGVGGFAEFAMRFDATRDALTASSDTRKSVASTKNAKAAYRIVKEWKAEPGAEDPRPSRNEVYTGMPLADRQTNQVGVDEAIRLGWLTEEKLGRGRRSYLSLGDQSPIHLKMSPRLASDAENDGEAS